ncbi:hypothetical protein BDA96_01G491100 [Sorghum bicolor]|uniref:Calmodulin-binding domain-containing protein n=2 Tax=Sorghum bicolor TaxID=4558 RepID=A0A921V3T5_SORBI|nr:uncharacterized protein LOC8081844 [Sorghum bicolor]XP_021306808.1 uncharacterized protein LOC8081844 [Sorghum bicolor]KAG0552236.1 hypothetical protein BDA96_01G491100 [Sorghum bicolor]KAG0552237.1 hypothetical protein BDA96_01G491100 [Sorghum bicolor]KXG39898.1 hypothetical protein SORBI_3001G460400 [Sorghum bicolor]KXG39899.1 hypothetical protein SORBI_3001G460400 [Sorghum bicolor]|eukprot:XP_021306807.1 uncharacterized protein LOC8081844 [Sorghum bicolor]
MSKDLEKGSSSVTTPTTSVSPLESKKREKTVPNYLRATRGSCHDFCKYGHKNPSEEEPGFSGGRRKKLPAHLNNLTLHRSAILDRSKDVKNRSVSLAKSSISLGEAERFAPKKASANRKGVPSSEVPRTATPSEHKSPNYDGRKMHSIVAQKAPTNLRRSNGVPKIDKKETMPAKGAIFPAKSKFPEKTLLEKSRNVDRVTMANQSLHKRPASSHTKLNMVKQGPVASQASSKHLLSKHKNTPEGPIAANITRMHAKAGQSPKRSSNSNINGKEGSDVPRSPLPLEPKLTASVEVQIDDPQITGSYIDSTLAELSSVITVYVDNSQPAPEETSKSISEDDGVGRTEKSEVLGGEALLGSTIALELQQSLDGKEFSAILGESDLEHKLPEHHVVHNQASMDYDSQTDYAALCQLPEVATVENTDVYDLISTQSTSKIEDDQVEVNASVESVISEDKEEMSVHEDFERSPGLLVLDKKHNEEPEYCLDLASGNAAENDTAGKVFDSRMNNSASHCQSVSETSSDGGLLEKPKSMLIEPSVFAGDELASICNENSSEQAELKSRIFIPLQSPEELSDNEFYEEYDFELSESDESGTEDEDTTINKNRDESLKSGQRSRRTSALELDDASLTPYKLKFKRGKIVELPPDSIGPRRLKFRRKSANEASNRESQPARRIYRRNSTSNAVPTDVESPGVKLRHQDAQEKKDAQGLFNNVIEETASKLVESRKSKVKALVGAFETVISLQDGKPTSSTAQAGNSQDSIPDDEGHAPEETG